MRAKHSLVVEAMETIDDDEVIETFVWPEIYIRQSTWEVFQNLQLPEDVVCCEAKLGWGFANEIREWLRASGLPNVRGFEQVFQHNLLRKVGAHYMGIQFLASWLKNWTFICIGGSANLFSIVPVKGLILFDTWFNNSSTEVCLRGLAQRRYGSLGNEIPVFLPKRQMFPVAKFLDLKKDLLAEAIAQLRGCRYGV